MSAAPTVDELRRMYCDEKLSSVDIGLAVGASPSTVCRWLKRAGIPARTPGEGSQNGAWKNRGKKREFTPEWRANLSAAGKRWSDSNAKGTRITSSGYIEYTNGPNKGRAEHQVVMEAHIGRALTDDEVVHHRDEDRANNAIGNLEVMTRAAHTALHQALAKQRRQS